MKTKFKNRASFTAMPQAFVMPLLTKEKIKIHLAPVPPVNIVRVGKIHRRG